jgi:hypothetical protein
MPMIAGMTKNFGNRVARKLSFSLIASASYALVFVIESTTRRGRCRDVLTLTMPARVSGMT